MTDLEALNRAILEHPDDDTPRLIFADALEDAGEAERAAFIRAHIAAERVPAHDQVALHFHLRELPARDGWPLDSLPELPPGIAWTEQPFRRGFPAAVEVGDGAAFLAHHRELFACAPVEEVHLTAIPLTHLQDLIDCPGLTRIRKLVLMDGAIGFTAERLLASPNLTRLDEFHLGSAMSTGATEAAVVRSPAFARLSGFGSRNVRWPWSFFAEAARLRNPPRLRTLDLARNSLALAVRPPALDARREQFESFLRSPHVVEVRDLDLSENNLGPAGVDALAAAPLPALERLSLRQTRPERDGLDVLARSQLLARLRSLNLAGNNLDTQALNALVHAAGVANLRVLDLSENRFGDAGAELLAAVPGLGNLLLLDVRDSGVSDPATARLRDRFGERLLA